MGHWVQLGLRHGFVTLDPKPGSGAHCQFCSTTSGSGSFQGSLDPVYSHSWIHFKILRKGAWKLTLMDR